MNKERVAENSRVVSFDLWMTLLKSNGRTFKTARNLLLRDTLACDLDGEAFDKLVRATDRQADHIAEDRGTDVGFGERINMVANAAGRPALDAVALEEFYAEQSRMFAANPPVLLDSNTSVLLDGLAADRDLAVISNTGFIRGQEMRHALGQLGILESFTHLIFSDEVGYAKPNPRIFEALLAKTGVEASFITHVGDNLVADIQGADAMGMRTVYMAPGMVLSDVIEKI